MSGESFQVAKPINWVESLKKYVEHNPSKRSMKEIEEETDKYFLDYMEKYKNDQLVLEPSLKKIPRFFQKNIYNENQNLLYSKVRQEARTRFLHHKTSEILDKEDLERLWSLIREHVSPPDDNTDRINYDAFLTIAKALPPKCRHFFSASTFLKFDRDEYGRIDIVSFFHSIVRKVSLFQTRIQISLYDSVGNGNLREKDLENYIFELIPTFSQLQNIPEAFQQYYVITAVRKFFFFLDPKKTGKIYIKDMLTSPILAELYDLRQEKSPEELSQNWFSSQNAERVYKAYLKLDLDENGLLKKQEMVRYQWGLTDIFIDRIFEEYQTFEGEMDYKTFLDFVLAMENKKSPHSLAYFWKILDIYGKGAIDSFVINTFFKEVKAKLTQRDPEAEKGFNVEDIKDELFDMAKPEDPKKITLNDLINSGQGHLIVSILTDAKAFFDYDQREMDHTINLEEENEANHHPPPLRPEAVTSILAEPPAPVNATSTFGKSKKVHSYNEV